MNEGRATEGRTGDTRGGPGPALLRGPAMEFLGDIAGDGRGVSPVGHRARGGVRRAGAVGAAFGPMASALFQGQDGILVPERGFQFEGGLQGGDTVGRDP